jgi:uncharacterized protein (TIGR02996 family)
MNATDGLLKEIVSAPFDATPRLVYADLLEENGDATHAEFVRVQCRMAELGGCEKPKIGATRHAPSRTFYCLECEWCLLRTVESRLWWTLDPPPSVGKDMGRALAGRFKADHWYIQTESVSVKIVTKGSELNLYVRRGFPERLEIGLQSYVGRPCELCYATGYWMRGDMSPWNPKGLYKCRACKGKGRFGCLADAIVRACPVVHIDVPDTWDNPDGTWHRASSHRGEPRQRLPDEIFDLLPPAPNVGRDGTGPVTWKEYPRDGIDCHEALSRALIDFGRTRAKLPAIQWRD